jgi:phosphatidylserine/phosphatidylglycerophosphate/cardiolipin synthase-like enzyme
VDDVVYLGSANLDTRSLRINYELMIRFDNKTIARRGARNLLKKSQELPSRHGGGMAQVAHFLAETETALGVFSAEPSRPLSGPPSMA